MRLNGVVTLALVLAALPLATAQASTATTYPACWQGKVGCKHSRTQWWTLGPYTGSVAASRTRTPTLTCADAANGPREEVVSGVYSVTFTMEPARSQTRIGADSKNQPYTAKPLSLDLNISRITNEKLHVVTPNADGSGCTESTRSCDKTGRPYMKRDTLSVTTRKHRVFQEMSGAIFNDAFVQCAKSDTVSSLLPEGGGLFGPFLDEITGLSNFTHNRTHVLSGRSDRPGLGEVTSRVRARLTYIRSIRACTYYSKSKTRCRTTRG